MVVMSRPANQGIKHSQNASTAMKMGVITDGFLNSRTLPSKGLMIFCCFGFVFLDIRYPFKKIAVFYCTTDYPCCQVLESRLFKFSQKFRKNERKSPPPRVRFSVPFYKSNTTLGNAWKVLSQAAWLSPFFHRLN